MTSRRETLTLTLLPAALLPAAMLPALPAAGAAVPNAVLDPGKATLRREPFGDLRIYFDGSTDQLRTLQAGSLRLKPGQSPHPPHQHPEEEILLVTEGQGEISLDGATTRAGPGAMMYCAAGRLHGIVNTGQTPLTFFFSKWIAR